MSNNITLLAIVGTTFISLAWIFRDLLDNFCATMILYTYPQYDKYDLISVKGETGIYEGLGFMRTPMRKWNGDLIYIPNRILLN